MPGERRGLKNKDGKAKERKETESQKRKKKNMEMRKGGKEMDVEWKGEKIARRKTTLMDCIFSRNRRERKQNKTRS